MYCYRHRVDIEFEVDARGTVAMLDIFDIVCNAVLIRRDRTRGRGVIRGRHDIQKVLEDRKCWAMGFVRLPMLFQATKPNLRSEVFSYE
jgi:hypothetical protein